MRKSKRRDQRVRMRLTMLRISILMAGKGQEEIDSAQGSWGRVLSCAVVIRTRHIVGIEGTRFECI